MDFISKQDNLKFYSIKILSRLFTLISSSKILTKLIFNIDILPYPHHNCQNWDFTTLILKKALDIYIKDNQKILEVGTGHLAILSISITKKRNFNVTATDINPAFIKNAQKNARKNNVLINFIKSDLFSKINEKFDIIFFNPPYISKEWVLRNRRDLFSNSIFDLVWNGGIDGCDIIRRFLKEISNIMYENSRILLGLNTHFINSFKMKKIVKENNLNIVSIISRCWTPSKVFVIRK